MKTLVREAAEHFGEEIPEDAMPLHRLLAKIADELKAMSVRGHGYGNRELSMCIARLEEARLWAIEYGFRPEGGLLLVDKREYAKALAVTTDKTDGSE